MAEWNTGLAARVPRWSGCMLLSAALLMCGTALARGDDLSAPLSASTVEPRAFGYRAGDVLERQLVIDVPARLTLDTASLPTVGPQGPVLELRTIERRSERTSGGQRLNIRLQYQVFAAPVAVRTYELPTLQLHFTGRPRDEDLRIEPWPVVVAALAMEDASPRTGLGELRPDTPPPLREATLERGVLVACGLTGAGLFAYLAWVYLGLPWWARRRRPFALAFKRVSSGRGADWPDSLRALHAAFDQTAGRTVFAASIDELLTQAPQFAPLRAEIEVFYAASQRAFFAANEPEAAPGAAASPDAAWLKAFARSCRNAERGSP
jgi:mxaA protein